MHGLLPTALSAHKLDRLVVSRGDFGLAYLNKGWAARFVSELFRNYMVCFVGYSLDDPMLGYMTDALAADRQLGGSPHEMFAFGSHSTNKKEEQADQWRAKHATPILYHESHDHEYLHRTLRRWAETYRDGIGGLAEGSGPVDCGYDEAPRSAPADPGMSSTEAHNNRGIAKRRLGLHEDTIADYDEAIRLKQDSAAAYYNRGNAKSDLGRHKDAIADYDEAIRLKPDDATAYFSRGNAKRDLGRHKDAIADYGQAIRLKPEYVDAYLNRGVAKFRLDRYEDAIADYDEAVRLEPDYAEAYRNRGLVRSIPEPRI